METITLELPKMYADHHVVEVRRVLLELAGVEEIDASSCFGAVELTFDPQQTSSEEIVRTLEEAGYWGDFHFPVETGAQDNPFFRNTAVNETVRQVVSFAQQVPFAGRPLWPCPGIGVVKKED